MNLKSWLLLLLFFFSTASVALEPEEVKRKLTQQLMVEVDKVQSSIVPGFYQAEIGGDLVHISKDGQFVLTGDLLDLQAKKNLSEQYRKQKRASELANMDKDSLIIFGPEKPEHVVTVFTDIDCGFCRKLHSQIDEYAKEGIQVRYISFPRSGPNTESYFKAVSVWCSEDKNKALTDAKNGKKLPAKECSHPIDEHLKMANQLNVRATPWIVSSSGQEFPGYLSPKDLLAKLLAPQ